jgi:hypothetical protein
MGFPDTAILENACRRFDARQGVHQVLEANLARPVGLSNAEGVIAASEHRVIDINRIAMASRRDTPAARAVEAMLSVLAFAWAPALRRPQIQVFAPVRHRSLSQRRPADPQADGTSPLGAARQVSLARVQQVPRQGRRPHGTSKLFLQA